MFKKIIISTLLLGLIMPSHLIAATSSTTLSGRILIAVEEKGEAWYVNPLNQKRYFLGRPTDAFNVMRQLGLGINNNTYSQIKNSAPKNLSGRIVINVEANGQAYYINPVNNNLYFLGRPTDAFNVMRQLGLGINNSNLNTIAIAQDKPVAITNFLTAEKTIQDLVNQERLNHGLTTLKWNDDLANVAREHSQNQATDNKKIINQNKLCSYPFIHHEGQTFGLHHSDRLNNRGVYYFSASAENIALIPKIKSARYESTGITPQNCQTKLNELNKTYEAQIEAAPTDKDKITLLNQEISSRINLTENTPTIKIIEQTYNDLAQVEQDAVTGWMNSPGHRRNILNPDYDEAGVGMAEINGYYIITQVFIKRATCGFKNGSCCQKDGYYPFCYVPWDCTNNLCQ